MTDGPEREGDVTIIAAMAQWWAPWRRQHAGRRESWLPLKTAVSGPREKNKLNRIEKPRRIFFLCYTRIRETSCC